MSRFKLHHFETIDSTQIEAKKTNYSPGDVVYADRQTAGYGRRGRVWEGPSGNLAMTMIEEWHGPEQFSWIGYAIGLALYEAVMPLVMEGDLRLKWPNDLMIDEKKLSGMILEVENNHLLIGIGMNVAVTPETDQPVTCLNNHTKTEQQAIDIIHRFLPRYEFWTGQGIQNGFSPMRETWLSRAAYIGETITAKLADGTQLTGIFNDIDDTGALVLTNENRQYKITTADIYLKKKLENDQKSLTG